MKIGLEALGNVVLSGMREKGFPVESRRPLEWIQLAAMELSEAAEEERNPVEHTPIYYPGGSKGKPEGLGIELADAVMIIAAYAVSRGINLDACIVKKHEFNKTRPALHGGKRF